MPKKLSSILILTILIAISLTACASSADPAQAIADYIEALVAKDGAALSNLSCAAWESGAKNELKSFDAVAVRLEGLRCETTSSAAEFTIVHCEGTIHATYEGEDRPLDLSAKDYLAVEEGGEWRMCGYK
ncbi:MAG: hypothetical protein JXB38_02425 [Anaerolineales bacterium]|nr:hypothetical protein [Anaerolineales bacterium]